jgi:hypothetical protein
MTMTTTAPNHPIADWEKIRAEWLGRLDDLLGSVQQWVEEIGWSSRRIEKRLEDSQIGVYQAPALLLQEGTTRMLLEPIARFAPGVEGVVDLYEMPAYDDIATLSFGDGGWRIHYWADRTQAGDLFEVQPVPFSKETLYAVLAEMKKNAA